MRIIFFAFSMALFNLGYTQQLPSTGFEAWTDNGLPISNYEDPTGWFTNNIQGISAQNPSTKTTDAHSGQYAVVLHSVFVPIDSIWSAIVAQGLILGNLPTDTTEYMTGDGMALQNKPERLRGWFKYLSQNGSQGSLTAFLSKWNSVTNARDTISFEEFLINHEANYTQQDFVFDYSGVNGAQNPDTIRLAFYVISPNLNVDPASLNNCQFFIDDLTLLYPGETASTNSNSLESAVLFPNPASDDFAVKMPNHLNEKYSLTITDYSGRSILFVENYSSNQVLEVNSLLPGEYLVTLKSEHELKHFKLLKN